MTTCPFLHTSLLSRAVLCCAVSRISLSAFLILQTHHACKLNQAKAKAVSELVKAAVAGPLERP